MAVLTWFESNDRRKMLFPSQSPDVNPIGNIWSWLKKDACEVKPTTREKIKAAKFKSLGIIHPAKIRTVFSSLLRIHRALCCLFRPDTDGTRVSKCGQLSQQTRRLDPMLFQCWSSAVGGGPILKQHWVECSRLLGELSVFSSLLRRAATILRSRDYPTKY